MKKTKEVMIVDISEINNDSWVVFFKIGDHYGEEWYNDGKRKVSRLKSKISKIISEHKNIDVWDIEVINKPKLIRIQDFHIEPHIVKEVNVAEMFVDASVCERKQTVGLGGILENEQVDPQMLIKFKKSEELNEVNKVCYELLAIEMGMLVAKDKGIKNILIHSDCRYSVQSLSGLVKINKYSTEVIQRINLLIKNFNFIRFVLIDRDKNKIADNLSREASGIKRSNWGR